MAKAKRKAIPAKRGTKRGRTAPARALRASPAESPLPPAGYPQVPPKAEPAPEPTPGRQIGQLVDITPANRAAEGYRELDVRALRDGHYGQRDWKQGDVFRVALVGDGELPPWMQAV